MQIKVKVEEGAEIVEVLMYLNEKLFSMGPDDEKVMNESQEK